MGAGTVTLGRDESRHAGTVLRLRAGDEVTLFDGAGRIADGVVRQVARGTVRVEADEAAFVPRLAGAELTLFVAMPRAGRQQSLFEKCTELGVGRIVPVVCERSTVVPKVDAVGKWRRITIEAAKQCGSAWLPEVRPPVSFRDSVAEAAGFDLSLFGAVGETPALLQSLAPVSGGGRVAVWIGPEGGLTMDEKAALLAIGAQPTSLGPLVLRVETAALAAATAVMLLRGMSSGVAPDAATDGAG